MDLSQNQFSGHLPVNFFDNLKSTASSDEFNMNTLIMGSYYQASTSLIIKGKEVQVYKILNIYTSVDLSSNNFSGKLSEVFGELILLRLLNISHNHLTGRIPSLLGNLSLLESLDLSSNQLTGTIPRQLTSLTFLSALNLSENNLSGEIPHGRQFDTFSNDSFLANMALCGVPLTKKCKSDEMPTREVDDEEDQFTWKMIIMGYGCGLVCGLSTGYIVFKTGKPWRFVKFIEGAQQKLIRTATKNTRVLPFE